MYCKLVKIKTRRRFQLKKETSGRHEFMFSLYRNVFDQVTKEMLFLKQWKLKLNFMY